MPGPVKSRPKVKRFQSRRKGNQFELVIAKQIVAAFSHLGIKEEHCFRTPGSGSHRQASKKDPGDHQIAPELRKYFPFCTECKSHKVVHWVELFEPGRGGKPRPKGERIKDWWLQACTAAKKQNLPPLLIFKQNQSSVFAMGRHDDLKSLQTSIVLDSLSPVLFTRVNGDDVLVVSFNRLLATIQLSVPP